jgi:hypothetical protein
MALIRNILMCELPEKLSELEREGLKYMATEHLNWKVGEAWK